MQRLLKLSTVFHIIIRSLFVCNIQGGGNVIGQFADFLDVNLLEDVAPPTPSSCERKRSIEQGSNEFPHDTTPNSPDDCLIWSHTCPRQIKISWQQAPPFIHETNASGNKSEQHTAIIQGIFHEVLVRSIGICCKTFSGTIPQIRFLKRASNLKVLHRDLIHGLADMIIPVHSDEEKYGGSFPYVKILDSPGVVIIQRYSTVKQWKLVLNAVLGTWPVLLMLFLMSLAAGVVIWALDSSHNPEEFPRKFHRGVFEGFWWAIVTITAVGYGDKTPKSVLARLFAVLWVTTGITVCAVMTATLASALTSNKFERNDFTTKKIAVLNDSVAIQDAVNMAANITILEDRDELYESLTSRKGIDSIMEEMFIGIESMKSKGKLKQMFIAKFIRHNRAFGVAYMNHVFEKGISDCLSNVIKFRYNDVLQITSNYIKVAEAAEGEKTSSEIENDAANVFDSHSPVLMVCIVALSAFILVVIFCNKLKFWITKHVNKKQKTRTTATEKENLTTIVIVGREQNTSLPVWSHGKKRTEV